MSINKSNPQTAMPPTQADLEETAELPVLPPMALASAGRGTDPLAGTDSWLAPSPAALSAAARSADADVAAPAAQATEANRGQLEPKLRALTANLRELEQLLHSKTEQLADFERQIGARDRRIEQLSGTFESNRAELETAQRERGELAALLEAVRGEFGNAQARLAAAETARIELATLKATEAQRFAHGEAQLGELRRRTERYREILQGLEGRKQLFDDLLGEREQLIAARENRIAVLERQIADHSRYSGARESDLQGALSAEKQGTQDLRVALEKARAEIDMLKREGLAARTLAEARLITSEERIHGLERAAEERARDAAAQELERGKRFEADLQAREATIRTLQGQMVQTDSDKGQLKSSLRVAEENVRALEAELRQREAAVAALMRGADELRTQLQAVQQSLEERNAMIARLETEAASSAEVLGSIQHSLEHPLDDKVRLLVRTEGDTGIVHVLGRKTTVGRTPDNDICLDGDFISRHHAVLLLSGGNTIVEDLNSTNGVYVNAKPVARQTLSEGDLVTIGKYEFRFVRKPQPMP